MIKLDDIQSSREYQSLSDIFNNDDLGLFNNIKPKAETKTANGILEQQFSSINDFIGEHGREPDADAATISEKILARQLSSIKINSSTHDQLRPFDKHSVLPAECKESISNVEAIVGNKISDRPLSTETHSEAPEVAVTEQETVYNSLEDIFGSDDLGLFDSVQAGIVVSTAEQKARAEREQFENEDVASRFECKDFYRFEGTFAKIQKAIESGDFTKGNVTSNKGVAIGGVFVLNGFVCYVADIYKAEARKDARSDERLRLIFSNGMESNMLTHSLVTAQYKYENSYQLQITDPDWVNDDLAKNFGDTRLPTGVIYIARLVDTPDNLKHYKNLHKIGFSKLTGDARTKNSVKDTAFLQQPVDIIAEWQVYDANPRSVEGVLHAFFYEQRVKLSSKGSDDNLYKATEWFDVPLSEIDKAVDMVAKGSIHKYRMDAVIGRIVLK